MFGVNSMSLLLVVLPNLHVKLFVPFHLTTHVSLFFFLCTNR